MLGLSYGELFLLLGATAALIGPKDLPLIAKTAGRLAGRSIGYVQIARGQFESIMQQSGAQALNKDLQETMAQVQSIGHAVRSVSIMNPSKLTTRLVDNIHSQTPAPTVNEEPPKPPQASIVKVESTNTYLVAKAQSSPTSMVSDIHSQATADAGLAELKSLHADSMSEVLSELINESGPFPVLLTSAESAELLPSRRGKLAGSDVLLEAITEADVAHNAKALFLQLKSKSK